MFNSNRATLLRDFVQPLKSVTWSMGKFKLSLFGHMPLLLVLSSDSLPQFILNNLEQYEWI